ncbi:MAG: phosphoenolpyruvate carboxykinase (ATP) [Chloroflexota bacterium]|jgi:phosphoenolpyruvate carboxykinase (ATP)
MIHSHDTPLSLVNLSDAALIEETIEQRVGHLSDHGALVVQTGMFTGRSPLDRYIVADECAGDDIWWGDVNRRIDRTVYDRLEARINDHFMHHRHYELHASVNADVTYAYNVKLVSESPWHTLFGKYLFRREWNEQNDTLTVLHAPSVMADPIADGIRSPVFIILNIPKRTVLIGGTWYAGEIKKAVFTMLNYLLPQRGVMPMHAGVNVGPAGDTAVFFGLSGTGKTTLSTDPQRPMIGDDEHGWSDTGIFNFEGGCYAKTIRLSSTGEPEIYRAANTYGAILENVVIDATTHHPDFDDVTLSENGRAAYPLTMLENVERSGRGTHPRTIIMLTADAFGVLPPISRLSIPQALYHFVSGYTAKVAGTERGVSRPTATFSTCFGAPFMMLHPGRYATLLHDCLRAHNVNVWLVNTGWSGGAYGFGSRMPLAHTRAMVNAAISGVLDSVDYQVDPVFGLAMPLSCPGVPATVLDPQRAWQHADEWREAAQSLAVRFHQNFVQFADSVPPEALVGEPVYK